MKEEGCWDAWFDGLSKSLVLKPTNMPDRILQVAHVEHITEMPDLPNNYTGMITNHEEVPR